MLANVDAMRVEHMRMFLHLQAFLLLLGCVPILLLEALGYEAWLGHNHAQALCIMGMTLVLIVPRLCPNTVRTSTLWAWYSLTMFTLVVCGLLLDTDRVSVLLEIYASLPLRTVACFAYGNPAIVLIWNLALSAVAVHGMLKGEAVTTDAGHQFALSIGALEVAVCCSLSCFAFVAHHVRCGLARHTAEALARGGENDAMSRLLGLTCDVVVELDTDLRLGKDSHKFAAWLDMNVATSWVSRKFTEFMPDLEDRSRFEELLVPAPGGESCSTPGVVHTTLRSSMRTRIEAEIFYVRRMCMGECVGFLGGIVELTDRAHCCRGPHAAGAHVIGPALPPNGVGSAAGEAHANLEIRSSSATLSQLRASSTACSESSVSTGFSNRSYALRHTSSRAQEHGIVAAMVTWELPPNEEMTCCLWHSHVRAAEAAVAALTDRDCVPHFKPEKKAQCQNCGLLSSLPVPLGRAVVCVSCRRRTVFRVTGAPLHM